MDRRRMMMASGTPEIERDWLKFDILTAGTVLWKCATGKERTISYRKSGGEWTKITSTTSGVSISVAKDDVLEFKGKNADYGGARSTSGQGSYFAGTATFNASGDVSTMLNNSEILPATLALAHLFHSAKVVSAENLILPYTTLTASCYYGMFYGCTSLTTTPDLPATTLATYCYQYMFRGCTNLVNIPYELPATTLKKYCYNGMFYGCSKLVEAPYLPATKLVSNCYASMFYNCSKLQYIRANFTTTPSSSYTSNWVSGVAAKGIFDKNGKTWSVTGVNGVPTGWLEYSGLAFIITSAGTITWTAPANNPKTVDYSTDNSTWTTMAGGDSINVSIGDVVLWKSNEENTLWYHVFGGTSNFRAVGNIMSLLNDKTTFDSNYSHTLQGLFKNSNITSARNLRFPVEQLSTYCYSSMFYGCTKLTTAPELPATTLADYCYYQMFCGCTSLTTAPELPATTLAQSCYSSMFYNCTKLTTAPELPATTLADYCYYSMFSYTNVLPDCTNIDFSSQSVVASGGLKGLFSRTKITDAQLDAILNEHGINNYSLPATTLADYCYYQMFYGCTRLTTAPELPATTLEPSCYFRMFHDCTSLSSITCLATDISANNCTYSWVGGVAANGTFTKAESMRSWTTGVNGIPSGWTVQDYIE